MCGLESTQMTQAFKVSRHTALREPQSTYIQKPLSWWLLEQAKNRFMDLSNEAQDAKAKAVAPPKFGHMDESLKC